MPIPKKTASTLLTRLKMAGLSFPPDSTEILCATLARRAESEKHASLVIDGWIDKHPEWPKPSDIAELCDSVMDPDSKLAQAARRNARENCRYCDGTGFRTVEGAYGTTAAHPCTHQPPTEAEQRMGVRFTPALARHYSHEIDRIPEMKARYAVYQLRDPKRHGNITHADVNRILGDAGLPPLAEPGARITEEDIDRAVAARCVADAVASRG